jgi:molecular chaperone GrpE
MAKAKKDETPQEKPLEAEIVEEAPEVSPTDEAEAALKAEKDKYLRLAAEYDNYRKRSIKEREAMYSEIRSDTIVRLLPVYDNLARALSQECSDEAFYKGVEMTMAQLKDILQKCGVTEIPAVGQPFNPDRHNAVMHVEDPALGEAIITEEFEKGFMIGDKVVRCSMVKVAN